MWTILENHTKATKVIDKAPKQVQRKYTVWKNIVEQDGPEALKKISGFKDHPLQGEWKGYRSSYLNNKYRVIYKVNEQVVTIIVEKIGPHNY